MVMYTLLYLKWITNKVLPYSTRNSAQCYVAAWMGRSLGENGDTCICMAEPLCCPPETITVLLIGYIPIQNKKVKFKKLFFKKPFMLNSLSISGIEGWEHRDDSQEHFRSHFSKFPSSQDRSIHSPPLFPPSIYACSHIHIHSAMCWSSVKSQG